MSGFPDPEQERIWQEGVSISSHHTTAHLGLLFEAVLGAAGVTRMWQAGMFQRWQDAYHVILFASTMLVWSLIHVRWVHVLGG
jgi:ABC-type enterobactin transport system permease subunit